MVGILLVTILLAFVPRYPPSCLTSSWARACEETEMKTVIAILKRIDTILTGILKWITVALFVASLLS